MTDLLDLIEVKNYETQLKISQCNYKFVNIITDKYQQNFYNNY